MRPMPNIDHLLAIEARIGREMARLDAARTPRERAFREREIRSAEKERADELRLLDRRLGPVPPEIAKLGDDELLAELDAAETEG